VPRKASPVLTDAELRIMDVLWERGESTVADAVKAFSSRTPLAYNTVLTTMRILEKKGYVAHRQEGRAFVYRPLVDRQAVRRSTVRHLLSRLFDDSPELLVLNVLEDERLDRAELERLKRLVDEAGGKEPRR
jgi:predicted transcriptional regulator